MPTMTNRGGQYCMPLCLYQYTRKKMASIATETTTPAAILSSITTETARSSKQQQQRGKSRYSFNTTSSGISNTHALFFFPFSHFYFPASGQAVVTDVVPSSPRFSPSIFIARRVQQSHCSSIFHRVLLTHALALYASQLVHKKKMHTGAWRIIHAKGTTAWRRTCPLAAADRIGLFPVNSC